MTNRELAEFLRSIAKGGHPMFDDNDLINLREAADRLEGMVPISEVQNWMWKAYREGVSDGISVANMKVHSAGETPWDAFMGSMAMTKFNNAFPQPPKPTTQESQGPREEGK